MMWDCIVLKDSYPKTRVKLQSAAWLQNTLVSMNSWCVSPNLCHVKNPKILKKFEENDSPRLKKKMENTEQQLQIWKTWFPIFIPQLSHTQFMHVLLQKPGIHVPHANALILVSQVLRESSRCQGGYRGGGHRESCAVCFLMQKNHFPIQKSYIIVKKFKIPFYLHSWRILVLGIFEWLFSLWSGKEFGSLSTFRFGSPSGSNFNSTIHPTRTGVISHWNIAFASGSLSGSHHHPPQSENSKSRAQF